MVRVLFVVLMSLLLPLACEKAVPPPSQPLTQETADLAAHCQDAIGKPRIEDVTARVSVAIGYDLANTILIRTADGHVIVDTGISPAAATRMKKDLLAKYPGDIIAIIYTHSHIDHVGGAAVWAGPETEIWAHASFRENFLKQYGLFQPIEQSRALKQFAYGIDLTRMPCSGIGVNPDIAEAMQSGARLPTHTFEREQTLKFGDTTLTLVHAPGETTDELYVWVEEDEALLPGDNIYKAFPNLYTIRGTTPRPIGEWIASLDDMRSRRPAALIPSHTVPIKGKEAIQEILTNYRDAIQWVHDQTINKTNRGLSIDQIVQEVALPAHLVDKPYLQPFYGQVDWSVRAIYDNNLGWFDGKPVNLSANATQDTARKEIELMGGSTAVMRTARKAAKSGDVAWALHLAAKLEASGLEIANDGNADLTTLLTSLYEEMAMRSLNSNRRGYLLRVVSDRNGDALAPPSRPDPLPETLAEIPLDVFFRRLTIRVLPEKTQGVHETVAFHFPDVKETFYITVRNGIAELSLNRILPGTPEPLATLTMASQVWRELALEKRTFALAVATGDISIDGSLTSFLLFMNRFDRDV